ncbi:unnamed protein product [Closterium sp. Naga37s-1]|nr:unnamed protein product [Closterium sp. Naga37s-1]
MAGVLCRSVRAKKSRIPWIALLLVAFLATATWQRAIASAKQLEGFDEDEFDDGADEEETEFVAPQSPPTRSVTLEPDQGTKATAGSDRDSKSMDTTSSEGPDSVGGSGGRSGGQAADWDDEEFEGVTPGAGAGAGEAAAGGKQFFGKPGSAQQQAQKARARRISVPRKPFHPRDFIAEGVFLAFLVIFAINYFVGKWQNEKIALSFANQFATEGNLLAKNFALIGTGDTSEPILVKEGQATFKLYASGRRFCEAMLVTLNLRSRHDLATLAWDALLSSKKDQVDVDVYMNEEDMAPFVLAVVPRKSAKAFIKENADLKEFASMLDAEVVLKGGGGSGKNKWAADELAIIGDSREAAYELLSDVIIDQLSPPPTRLYPYPLPFRPSPLPHFPSALPFFSSALALFPSALPFCVSLPPSCVESHHFSPLLTHPPHPRNITRSTFPSAKIALFGGKSFPKLAPLFCALHVTDQHPTGAGAHTFSPIPLSLPPLSPTAHQQPTGAGAQLLTYPPPPFSCPRGTPLPPQLFGEKSFPKIAPLFRALHFTDQQPTGAGAHRKVLRFSFLLPRGGAAELAKLMASVPFFIDAVGKFRLSAQVRRFFLSALQHSQINSLLCDSSLLTAAELAKLMASMPFFIDAVGKFRLCEERHHIIAVPSWRSSWRLAEANSKAEAVWAKAAEAAVRGNGTKEKLQEEACFDAAEAAVRGNGTKEKLQEEASFASLIHLHSASLSLLPSATPPATREEAGGGAAAEGGAEEGGAEEGGAEEGGAEEGGADEGGAEEGGAEEGGAEEGGAEEGGAEEGGAEEGGAEEGGAEEGGAEEGGVEESRGGKAEPGGAGEAAREGEDEGAEAERTAGQDLKDALIDLSD